MALGTTALPGLFAASLLLTLVFSPTVSSLLHRYADKGAGMQVLYRSMAASIFGELQWQGGYAWAGTLPHVPSLQECWQACAWRGPTQDLLHPSTALTFFLLPPNSVFLGLSACGLTGPRRRP